MNPQNNHSPVSAQPPQPAIAPPVADSAAAEIQPAQIEKEARSAWFHAQMAVGLVATEVGRVMSKIFGSLDEKKKPTTRH